VQELNEMQWMIRNSGWLILANAVVWLIFQFAFARFLPMLSLMFLLFHIVLTIFWSIHRRKIRSLMGNSTNK